MDPRRTLDHDPAPMPIVNGVLLTERLVTAWFGDSWSTLEQEVALIDRLFGGEIARLFERYGDDDRRDIRG